MNNFKKVYGIRNFSLSPREKNIYEALGLAYNRGEISEDSFYSTAHLLLTLTDFSTHVHGFGESLLIKYTEGKIKNFCDLLEIFSELTSTETLYKVKKRRGNKPTPRMTILKSGVRKNRRAGIEGTDPSFKNIFGRVIVRPVTFEEKVKGFIYKRNCR